MASGFDSVDGEQIVSEMLPDGSLGLSRDRSIINIVDPSTDDLPLISYHGDAPEHCKGRHEPHKITSYLRIAEESRTSFLSVCG